MESKKITIRFDGKLNQVHANTFINSLASFVSIVEESNKQFYDAQKIDIKINALGKGSFLVELDILFQTLAPIAPLITSTSVGQLADLITIVSGVYKLRKFLKGRKPKQIEEKNNQISVINNDGKKIIVHQNIFNFYSNNENVQEALNNNFEALNADKNISKYEILEKGFKSIFKADKKEFEKLTSQERINEIKTEERRITVRTFLNLFKIVFDDKYKWEFIYKGNKISANILDEKFFDKINKGEKFSKGDLIEVELEIKQELDPSVNTYINRGYTITKVFSHKNRDEQLDLDFS